MIFYNRFWSSPLFLFFPVQSLSESPPQTTAPRVEPPPTVGVKPATNPSVSHRPVVPKKPEMHGDGGGKAKLFSGVWTHTHTHRHWPYMESWGVMMPWRSTQTRQQLVVVLLDRTLPAGSLWPNRSRRSTRRSPWTWRWRRSVTSLMVPHLWAKSEQKEKSKIIYGFYIWKKIIIIIIYI